MSGHAQGEELGLGVAGFPASFPEPRLAPSVPLGSEPDLRLGYANQREGAA